MNPGSNRPRLREELLGYLLGALEPSEREQLEAHLEADPELRAELDRLRAMTEGLDDCPVEPPGDLSHRTMRYVMDRRGPQCGQFAAESRWRIQDLVVAVCIVVTGSLLLFPAIGSSRCESQIRACQRNLMSLGKAMIGYSQLHDGEFPRVATEGKLAAAGVYAPTLKSAGLIDGNEAHCPAARSLAGEVFAIPSLDEVQAAEGAALRQLQARMGGSYGYSLGYVIEGRYHPLRNLGRPTFALLADLPDETSSQGLSCHGSYGQNVLFEDGHVQLLKGFRVVEGGDHIYQNELGLRGPGIGPNDAVISPSATAPVILWVSE